MRPSPWLPIFAPDDALSGDDLRIVTGVGGCRVGFVRVDRCAVW